MSTVNVIVYITLYSKLFYSNLRRCYCNTLNDLISLTVVTCFEQLFFVDDGVGPSYLIHMFTENIIYYYVLNDDNIITCYNDIMFFVIRVVNFTHVHEKTV